MGVARLWKLQQKTRHSMRYRICALTINPLHLTTRLALCLHVTELAFREAVCYVIAILSLPFHSLACLLENKASGHNVQRIQELCSILDRALVIFPFSPVSRMFNNWFDRFHPWYALYACMQHIDAIFSWFASVVVCTSFQLAFHFFVLFLLRLR